MTLLERQLNLLRDVPDVRIVVGFEADDVMRAARKIRPDAIFVRNAAFRSTTTLVSYAMGAAGLAEPCLFMDADIVFSEESFQDFLNACGESGLLIAITPAKTLDAVYVHLDTQHRITKFSRTERSEWEWANMCWLPPRFCETGAGAVFERLSSELPLAAKSIISFEIDTPEDHKHALEHCEFL
ncbi:hypothetical protein ASB57_21950 [Bordetella sp. N]|nr:hypothetical protein ASB57_21950 [Bordetella sp. N]